MSKSFFNFFFCRVISSRIFRGKNQMSNETPPRDDESPPKTIEIEQIKQIYDYTKFHIGMYSTLLTLLIALHTYTEGDKNIGQQYRWVILPLILILLIGGIAGAIAASRIVYGPWKDELFTIEKSWFWKKRPFISRKLNWDWNWTRWFSVAGICLTIEHYAFWAALIFAIVTLTCC